MLALRLLESDPGIGLRAGADLAGAALVTAALMLGVYTIVGTVDHGWASAHTLGFGAAAAVLLAGFVARQATASRPLVPLRIFRSRNVAGANVVQTLMVAGMFGMFFLGTLYLQRVLGYDAVADRRGVPPGLRRHRRALAGLLARGSSPASGARAVLLPGLVLLVAGLVLLDRRAGGGDYVTDLLPALVLLGVGAGVAFPALVTLAMSGATASDSGLASGLVNTTQQVGGALGLAVLATLSSSHTNHLLADGESGASALTGGYHLAFGIAAGLVVAAILVAATVLRSERAVALQVAQAERHPREELTTPRRRDVRRAAALRLDVGYEDRST